MKLNQIVNIAVDDRHCHQDKRELSALLKLIQQEEVRIYMEIGTYYAGGLWAVSKVLPKEAILIGVDNSTLDTTISSIEWTKKWNIKGAKIFERDSQLKETKVEIQKWLNGRKVDFLFIDGNHDYDYVKQDYLLYSNLVRKGGLIAFHDIYPPDATRNASTFWSEIKDIHESFEIKKAQGWGGVGIIRV